MTNDPEIRAAVLAFYDAHIALLWAAADLTQALPAEAVGDSPYLKLRDSLAAETQSLRALAEHIECPDARAELSEIGLKALGGRP